MSLIFNLKKLKNKYSILHFISNTILRPKDQYKKYLLGFLKLISFLISTNKLYKYARSVKKSKKNDNLFIIAGSNLETSWTQIFIVLLLLISDKIKNVYVLTSRKSFIQNLYYLKFNFKFIYIEDLDLEIKLPKKFIKEVKYLKELNDFRDFVYDDVPFGRIALSSFCRSRKTGIIDIKDRNTFDDIIKTINYHYKVLENSKRIYKKHNIKHIYCVEVFMYEYGPFYYGALNNKLNIIKFNGTVRDNAIVISRWIKEDDRRHFSSFSDKTWGKIKNYPINKKIIFELEKNFEDRYGQKWHMSKRNQPNTDFYTSNQIRKKYKIKKDTKVAIIYSHILFDLLYFHGQDLYDNYADWFTSTVKEIIKNDNLVWFIKIHPSNVWRGEVDRYNKKTEEEKLIKSAIGKLPEHVKLIYPDSEINPLSWLNFTDYGVTVRGTSGIELGALGKQVITAGTGRYEKIGFTINPKSKKEYIDQISNIHKLPPLSKEKKNHAQRFAYATFCMKPFTLDFIKVKKSLGVKKIKIFDDLTFIPNIKFPFKKYPDSIKRFKLWMFEKKVTDFLNDWPS